MNSEIADVLERLRDVRSVPWVGGEFDAEAFDLAGTNELLELYDRQTRQRRSRR